jgi:hypothetical protein
VTRIGSAIVAVGSEQAARELWIVCWGEETTCRSHRIVTRDDTIVFREHLRSLRWRAMVIGSPLGSTRRSLTAWGEDRAVIGRHVQAVAERRTFAAGPAIIESDSRVLITHEVTRIRRPQETIREHQPARTDEAMTRRSRQIIVRSLLQVLWPFQRDGSRPSPTQG